MFLTICAFDLYNTIRRSAKSGFSNINKNIDGITQTLISWMCVHIRDLFLFECYEYEYPYFINFIRIGSIN